MGEPEPPGGVPSQKAQIREPRPGTQWESCVLTESSHRSPQRRPRRAQDFFDACSEASGAVARFVRLAVGRGGSGAGQTIELKQVAQELTDLIWQREQSHQQPVGAAVLRFVQGAVAAELEYRRNMRNLNLLLAEFESPEETVSPVIHAPTMVRTRLIDEGAAGRQPDGKAGEAVSPAP